MVPSPSSGPPEPDVPNTVPNTVFRRLRGDLSPGEFSAAVRRAAREIGERVSCDARYVGRVESGEIRCPNYAYERVFKHMFPGLSLAELGFAPRESVRGRQAGRPPDPPAPGQPSRPARHAEDDALRRAIITRGPAAALAATLPIVPGGVPRRETGARVGGPEAGGVEEAVRRIRLLDDRHGADGLYERAGQCLKEAYALLERSTYSRPVADRLYSGSGELAISVGWLAHDSGRHAEARAYYAEALATARAAGDAALEAHAFCNASFLARDDGRPREAVRTAQAGQQAASRLGSRRLLALLALREAGGWAELGDRTACERALGRADRLFGSAEAVTGPEWMSFFGEAEKEGLQAQAWSALGDHRRAAAHARRGVLLQDPHFTRNIALYSAELAGNLAAGGEPDEAAETAARALGLLGERVGSTRIRTILAATARALSAHHDRPAVAEFLDRAAVV